MELAGKWKILLEGEGNMSEKQELIFPEMLPEVRKATGMVYQILTETMERYHKKTSKLYAVKLSDELNAKKAEAYKLNNLFPHLFFDEIADQVLRWHDKKFRGINDNEIKPLFQRLWKYHRMFLGTPLTDELVDQFMKEGDTIAAEQNDDAKPFVIEMIIAICHDLDDRNPVEEQTGEKTDEQAAETTSGETL